jgi:hypothetical protein
MVFSQQFMLGAKPMTIMPIHLDRNTVGLIEQLRDALKHADAELQRRCVISSKIRGALSAAEEYLTPSRNFRAPPL